MSLPSSKPSPPSGSQNTSCAPETSRVNQADPWTWIAWGGDGRWTGEPEPVVTGETMF
jgi:hypothetical protein